MTLLTCERITSYSLLRLLFDLYGLLSSLFEVLTRPRPVLPNLVAGSTTMVILLIPDGHFVASVSFHAFLFTSAVVMVKVDHLCSCIFFEWLPLMAIMEYFVGISLNSSPPLSAAPAVLAMEPPLHQMSGRGK